MGGDCEGWELTGTLTQPVFNELARCIPHRLSDTNLHTLAAPVLFPQKPHECLSGTAPDFYIGLRLIILAQLDLGYLSRQVGVGRSTLSLVKKVNHSGSYEQSLEIHSGPHRSMRRLTIGSMSRRKRSRSKCSILPVRNRRLYRKNSFALVMASTEWGQHYVAEPALSELISLLMAA